MKAAPQAREALVLDVVRRLFEDRVLHATDLKSVGINFDHGAGGSLPLGDHRLVGLIQEAGRAAECGDEAIDLRIVDYLDNMHGFGRWREARPPYAWERGGGDSTLETLLDEEETAITERKRLEAAMWKCRAERRDLLAKADRGGSVSAASLKDVDKEIVAATEAWEAASERERRARGAVCTRQSYLQERWLRAHSLTRA